MIKENYRRTIIDMNSPVSMSLIYFMIGCFSLNSLYHFFLFFFYKKNYQALYFALINLTALLFNLMHLFQTPYDQKIGTLIFIANPFFFLMFINSFVPDEFSPLFNKIYAGISAALFLVILAIPNRLYMTIFGTFNKAVMAMLVLYAIYVLQALVRAVIHKRDEALPIFLGMAVLLAFSFIRYLLRDSFVRIPNPVGALFLMFLYTLTLAKRFSDAYFRCSEVVKEKTSELNEANALLTELAMHDPLTGLNNRRSFFESADRILNHSRRYGSGFSILLLDLDYFKKVNDRYGHQTGDSVLKGLADTLEDNVRSADVTARYGGEEFVILLDQIELDEAVHTAEKIRRKVAGLSFLDDEEKRISVTVSIGIAAFEEGTPSVQDIINRADEALYRSKADGRNCSSYMDRDGKILSVPRD